MGSVLLTALHVNVSYAAPPAFAGSYAGFVETLPAKQASYLPFVDAEGNEHRLSEYQGKVILVNFWATWCAACVYEMPLLDKLQVELGGDGFSVVTISQDKTESAYVGRFLKKRGINNLPLLFDRDNSLGDAFGQDLLPTSILIDAKGYEIGRLVGPADWSSPEAFALIHYYLPGKASVR